MKKLSIIIVLASVLAITSCRQSANVNSPSPTGDSESGISSEPVSVETTPDNECSGINDLSVKTSIMPFAVQASGDNVGLQEMKLAEGDFFEMELPPIAIAIGRFNFEGEKYKDVVMLGNGTKLDIAYHSTFMNVNGESDVLHYGLRAEPTELADARTFVRCYGEKDMSNQEDEVVLGYQPDQDIILIRVGDQGLFVPISTYEVDAQE
jgi:hypothetical protein